MKKPVVKRNTRLNARLLGSPNGTGAEAYETRLGRDREWAMSEGSKFFQGKSEVKLTLKKIAKRLGELGIDYVVVGGMAMFQHGYRRFTDDVDLLVTREALKNIHRELTGLGYIPPFQGSKNLRDTEYGVKIEFLVTGEFPGDGKPKPVAFPDPALVTHEIDGIRYISLQALIELKLASGMTNSERMKDLADVIELIKALDLAADFSERLNPFVQAKYKELWHDAHPAAKRYITLWPINGLTAEAKSLEELIEKLRATAATLQAMLADGVTLDPQGGTADDFAHLVTTDPVIAKKYGMHDEKEFLGEESENEERESDDQDSKKMPPGS